MANHNVKKTRFLRRPRLCVYSKHFVYPK